MNAKFLNPFLDAAMGVLETEANLKMTRGDLRLDKEPYVTGDVTVIISMVGGVEGNVFYSLSMDTAIELASRMMGEQFEEFNYLVQSGIAELGNVITGRASVLLAQAGFVANISPPTLLTGKGAVISTLDYPRLVVPFNSSCGPIMIHLALREGRRDVGSAASIPVPDKPSA